MKILYAREFQKQFNKLPIAIKRKYYEKEIIFKSDWRDSRLHTKKLTDKNLAFSFRINRKYRALFSFVEKEIVLMATIGHRKDVY